MRAIIYKDDLGEEFETTEIPAELAEQAHEYHHQLIDAISHFDDEVLEAYIEDESSVTPEMIRRAVRAATLADEVTPVLLGAVGRMFARGDGGGRKALLGEAAALGMVEARRRWLNRFPAYETG